MKTRLVTVLLLTLLSIPLISAPKPKYKSIWLSGCACYDGYQIKKVPEGEGKLTVYNPENIKVKDVLSGKFTGNKVTDATLTFAGGLEYKGNMSYKLLSDGIEYTLTGGDIKVYQCLGRGIDGDCEVFSAVPEFRLEEIFRVEEIYFNITPDSPKTILRKYSGFETKHEAFMLNMSEKNISRASQRLIKDFKPLFKDNFEYKETYDIFLNINRGGYGVDLGKEKYFKLYIDTDRYIECFRDRRSFKYVLSDDKGRLIVSYGEYSHFVDYDGTEILERYIDGGIVTVSKTLTEKTDIRKSFSAENEAMWKSIKHWPPLIKHSQEHNTGIVQIKYSDGSIYTGRLGTQYPYRESDSEVSNTILTVLSYKNLPDRSLYDFGVLNYPDGRQVVFNRGYTLEECVRYSENRAAKIWAEEQAERQAEEQAKKEAKLKRQQEIQRLSSKYGKKYVDLIFESGGREILVGTPFGLIEEVGHIISTRLEIDHGSSKCYDWFFITDGYKYRKGYFWVRDGKVSSVVYY